MTKIMVSNQSTVADDATIIKAIQAIQVQVHRDFAPVWGIDADIIFQPKGQKLLSGRWQVVVLDTSDQQGALGYHDYTADGQPIGKIFAKSDIESGSSLSVTMSHEILEMLGDPGINLTTMIEIDGKQLLYAYENCDAVEADEIGYKINGTLVSNFVYPSWFEPYAAKRFDHGGVLKNSFDLAPGGYIGVMDLNKLSAGWTQITARKGGKRDYLLERARLGSRRDRRRTPRAQWMKSTSR